MRLWSFLNCVSMIVCSFTKRIVTKKPEPQGKIVGGKPVSMNQFPHACVVISYGSICGGSIINSWTVMSAAHCFDKHNEVEDITLEMGSRWLYDVHAQIYTARKLVVHEYYNQTKHFSCDIALIFAAKAIKFGPLVQKGILVNHKHWMKETETNFTVIGWGLTKYGGKLSDEGLLMTTLRYVHMKSCEEMHFNHTFTDDMFCLYGHGSKDSCKGDSGGGVMWNGKIVGIVSHGDGCASINKPSVYSNVWYFRPWIQKKVDEFAEWLCVNGIEGAI